MLIVKQERTTVIELEGGNKTRAVAFSANGDYLVSGDEKKVRVWRVEDGEQIATMAAGLVNCLAASKDGRLISAGTFSGEMVVWGAQKAFRKVFSVEDHYVIGLDFSPDSTRLVAASFNCTATVWDIEDQEQALTIRLGEEIIAVKYSPLGDRIVVATGKSIRIYNSDNGRLFVDIKAEVTPWYNTGLLWSNSDQILIVSESKIKQIDVSTVSVSEWSVPDSDASSCIALQQQGEFVAYSANRTVTIWDTSDGHTQLDIIHHGQIIRSIAISPDDRFLAIAGERGKIVIRRLPRSMTASIVSRRVIAYLKQFSDSNAPFTTGVYPFVSSTPHFPGTRHPDPRRGSRFMEAGRIRERGRAIDRGGFHVSESKPRTCWSCSCPGSFETVGRSDRRC